MIDPSAPVFAASSEALRGEGNNTFKTATEDDKNVADMGDSPKLVVFVALMGPVLSAKLEHE